MTRRTLQTLAATLFVGTATGVACTTARAQNPNWPPYQGMQPGLVEGVEDGLATGRPKARHAYAAAPDVLAVVLDARALTFSKVLPYEKQAGDVIGGRGPAKLGPTGREEFRSKPIVRDGKEIGTLIGPERRHYQPSNRVLGEKLDLAWADAADSYAISSPDDPAYRTPRVPVAVWRKTKPEVREWAGGKQENTARHEILLRLPAKLVPGRRYRVAFRGAGAPGPGVTVTFDDRRLRSEAVHVTLGGYHPRQPEKLATLSYWLGAGGGADFGALREFAVVEDATGREVFRGPVALKKPGVPGREMVPEGQEERDDSLPMPVYALDFSKLETPGVYRVVVPGLGSSFPFRLDAKVWEDAAKVSATGYLNQRCGIALGPPHTKYVRPREMHPADGFPVRSTDPTIFYDEARFGTASNTFKRIQGAIREDTNNPDAWGGWHDAADFDRSVLPQNHMRAVHAMLDLWESNPAYFERLSLNIPESGNPIPDVLDEALWCMDLFLRLQQKDGGVPSAVESIEHPSEPSTLLSQPTALTPPHVHASHVYAAAAAQLSLALRKYDGAKADAYRDSALRAMAWAEAHPEHPDLYRRNYQPPVQHANLAAAWMWRLTGDEKWHRMFAETLAKAYPGDRPIDLYASEYAGPWGAAVYALTPTGGDGDRSKPDPELLRRCREGVLASADAKAARTSAWTFHVGPQRFRSGEKLGQPWEMIAAHRLTGDAKYRTALLRMAQYALGNNPLNASFTSGIGARTIVPFAMDANWLGVAYPEGITSYGPLPRSAWQGAMLEGELAPDLYPAWKHWPWAESFFNVRVAPITEYTVGGTMANVLLVRAYLAQSFAARP